MHFFINEALYIRVIEGVHDACGSFMQHVEVKFEAEECIQGLEKNLGNM
jgi:hypothetical protein